MEKVGNSESLLVRFQAADGPALLRLSEGIGWRLTLDDWQVALAAGAVFGQRSVEGDAVSTATILRYGQQLSSIGFVITRPDQRRQGLARAAIHECLNHAPAAPIMLVATSEGIPLYESFAFHEVEAVSIFVADEPRDVELVGACSSIGYSDMPTILRLDSLAYGADRKVMLEERWKHASGGLLLSNGSGYALKILQRDQLIVGPVVASDVGEAVALVACLVSDYVGRLRINVPTRQTAFIEALVGIGFKHHHTLPLMVRNGQALPGRRNQIFALASLGMG